jgi:hypothetical protein
VSGTPGRGEEGGHDEGLTGGKKEGRRPNLLGLLGWDQILPGSGTFLMTPSKQALMRVT